MRKLSLLLFGCCLASGLIEALAVPPPGSGLSVPAWYTYPKVKRMPWGTNMERVVVYNDNGGNDEVTTRDSSDPSAPTPPGEVDPAEVPEPKPCNCAQCSGNRNRRQKYVKLPIPAMTSGKKPRFFGFGYPYVDDYYEEYDHEYYGGGGYPYGGGGGFGWGGGGYGGYPYGGGGGYGGYPYGGMGGYW